LYFQKRAEAVLFLLVLNEVEKRSEQNKNLKNKNLKNKKRGGHHLNALMY